MSHCKSSLANNFARFSKHKFLRLHLFHGAYLLRWLLDHGQLLLQDVQSLAELHVHNVYGRGEAVSDGRHRLYCLAHHPLRRRQGPVSESMSTLDSVVQAVRSVPRGLHRWQSPQALHDLHPRQGCTLTPATLQHKTIKKTHFS